MKHCLFLFFYFLSLMASAQPIQVFVKKGSIELGNKMYNSGAIAQMDAGQTLDINPGALCLMKMGSRLVELQAGKTYSYEQVKSQLKPSTGFGEAFVQTITQQQVVQKRTPGITTRGNEADPWEYTPKDSVCILSDSLTIKAGNPPLRLREGIRLMGAHNNIDTVFDANLLHFTIQTPREGTYVWSYQGVLENKKGTGRNVFFVPPPQQKKMLLEDYLAFKKSLGSFSEEMQKFLLKEYQEVQRIYLR